MKLTFLLYLIPGLIAVDLAAKAAARTSLGVVDQPIPIAPMLSLRLAEDASASLGKFSAAPALIAIASAALILAFSVWLYRTRSRREMVGLALIIAGAISNTTDRIVFGSSTDFLAWGTPLSPIFTISFADLWVGAGVVALFGGALVNHIRLSRSVT